MEKGSEKAQFCLGVIRILEGSLEEGELEWDQKKREGSGWSEQRRREAMCTAVKDIGGRELAWVWGFGF